MKEFLQDWKDNLMDPSCENRVFLWIVAILFAVMTIGSIAALVFVLLSWGAPMSVLRIIGLAGLPFTIVLFFAFFLLARRK